MKKDLSFIERHFKGVEKVRQLGKQRNRKTQKQAERCKDRKAEERKAERQIYEKTLLGFH